MHLNTIQRETTYPVSHSTVLRKCIHVWPWPPESIATNQKPRQALKKREQSNNISTARGTFFLCSLPSTSNFEGIALPILAHTVKPSVCASRYSIPPTAVATPKPPLPLSSTAGFPIVSYQASVTRSGSCGTSAYGSCLGFAHYVIRSRLSGSIRRSPLRTRPGMAIRRSPAGRLCRYARSLPRGTELKATGAGGTFS